MNDKSGRRSKTSFLLNAKKLSNFDAVGFVLDLGLLLLANGDKVLGHVAHVHHAGSVLKNIVLLFLNTRENLLIH